MIIQKSFDDFKTARQEVLSLSPVYGLILISDSEQECIAKAADKILSRTWKNAWMICLDGGVSIYYNESVSVGWARYPLTMWIDGLFTALDLKNALQKGWHKF